jgi:short-subunit dehydrogenase involved in D-alanine esterification of teichoic acids
MTRKNKEFHTKVNAIFSWKPSFYDSVFVAEAFQRAIENFGTLDIVVNNAALLDESEWEKEVDINLVGHIRLYCIYIYKAIYGTNMR